MGLGGKAANQMGLLFLLLVSRMPLVLADQV